MVFFLTEEEYDEQEEEQEVYQEDDYAQPKKRIKLSDTKRKILTYGIIILVSFSLGCGIVGFSMLSSENSARKDLANTDLYLATIIDSFLITAYNETDEDFYTYSYKQNSTNTFETEIGEVVYNDEQANLEFMEITIAPAVPEITV